MELQLPRPSGRGQKQQTKALAKKKNSKTPKFMA